MLYFIGFIQLLDIIIHAGTNQLELIRVTANILILIWVFTSILCPEKVLHSQKF